MGRRGGGGGRGEKQLGAGGCGGGGYLQFRRPRGGGGGGKNFLILPDVINVWSLKQETIRSPYHIVICGKRKETYKREDNYSGLYSKSYSERNIMSEI